MGVYRLTYRYPWSSVKCRRRSTRSPRLLQHSSLSHSLRWPTLLRILHYYSNLFFSYFHIFFSSSPLFFYSLFLVLFIVFFVETLVYLNLFLSSSFFAHFIFCILYSGCDCTTSSRSCVTVRTCKYRSCHCPVNLCMLVVVDAYLYFVVNVVIICLSPLYYHRIPS